VVELDSQPGILQEADDAVDVVGVHVGDHQQLEPALRFPEPENARAQGVVRGPWAAIDQDAMQAVRGVAVLHDQGVAVRRGQHFDREHRSSYSNFQSMSPKQARASDMTLPLRSMEARTRFMTSPNVVFPP
jgi:hypothetical protein